MKSLHHIFNTSKTGTGRGRDKSDFPWLPAAWSLSGLCFKGPREIFVPLGKATASPSPSTCLEFGQSRALCGAGLLWGLGSGLGLGGPFLSGDSETATSHRRNWFAKVSLAWRAWSGEENSLSPFTGILYFLLNKNSPDFSIPCPTGKSLSHTPTLAAPGAAGGAPTPPGRLEGGDK